MTKQTIRQQEIQRLEELLEFYRTHSTIQDLATRYGVSVSTVEKWRTNYPDFPKPADRLLSAEGFMGARTLRQTYAVDEWLALRRFHNPNFGTSRPKTK